LVLASNSSRKIRPLAARLSNRGNQALRFWTTSGRLRSAAKVDFYFAAASAAPASCRPSQGWPVFPVPRRSPPASRRACRRSACGSSVHPGRFTSADRPCARSTWGRRCRSREPASHAADPRLAAAVLLGHLRRRLRCRMGQDDRFTKIDRLCHGLNLQAATKKRYGVVQAALTDRNRFSAPSDPSDHVRCRRAEFNNRTSAGLGRATDVEPPR
jgi:hypothetical protein